MLNLRCSFCQTPYTLSRLEMLDALQEMDAHKLTHYDAHCPRCRRATPILRQRLEMAMPNWREALKQFEVEMKEHPQHEAPLPAHEPVPAPAAESKPEPTPVEEKPATTSSAKGKKEVAKKPAAKAQPAAKPTAKATATKASPSKGKKRTR